MREMRVLLVGGLLAAAACGSDERNVEVTAADSARVAENASVAVSALAPIRALSMAEVEFGNLASQRAGSGTVREYARTVAADHRALIGALDSVAQVRNLSLAESRETQELSNTVRMAHSGLENLAGGDFDLPFVRAEVESHRMLLDRVDQQLISVTDNPDLRTLLTDIRAMADAHLTRARQLLAQQLGESADPRPEQTPAREPSTPQRPPPPPRQQPPPLHESPQEESPQQESPQQPAPQ
ncbi:MAG: DUF4142 domain-containing protein [Longimicrobiales bacterium]